MLIHQEKINYEDHKMNIQIKFNEDAWIGLADEYKSIVKRSKQAVIKNRKF